MTQEEQRYKRRNYFIKKEFQAKFILKFCLILLGGIVLSTGLLLAFSRDTLTTSFDHSRLVVENTGLALLPSIIYTNLITLGLITLAAIVVTLFASHKIAGPMFRIEKELKSIGAGKLDRQISFRQNDQAVEIAESLNEMTKKLHEKVLGLRSETEQILESAGDDPPGEIISRLKELLKKFDSKFKL